jgi:mono/diheme cytochrome c family protein
MVVVAGVAACAHPTARTTGQAPRPASALPSAVESPPPLPPLPKIERLATGKTGSGVLLANLDGKRVAYVADEDAALIRVVDVEAERELSTFAPGGAPSQIVMLADGRLVASVRDAAKLVVLRGGGSSTSKLHVDATIDMPAEPIGLALTPDDESLVATSGWGKSVVVLDAHTFTRKAVHAVAREPRSIVVSDDGKRAFVSHAVGPALDVIALDGAKNKSLPLKGDEELPSSGTQARMPCQGFALAKTDTGHILAPHVLVFPGEARPSEGYGGGFEGREAEVFHVPVIDEDAATIVNTSTTLRSGFEPGFQCALPRAAAVGKAGLFVTCLGEDSVQLYDADALNPHDVPIAKWSVPAGPTAVAVDDEHDRAFVWSQFAHSLTTIATETKRPFALSSMTFDVHEDEKLAKGRKLFHATGDRRISFDGRACASCHPDGRDDALVWSSPNGQRQTPILAGRLSGAAPFGWNGDANDVNTHLISTMKRLSGTGMEGEDKEALVAYVLSMKGPATAVHATDAVTRGRALFRSEDTQCANCHGLDGDLPDGSQHDVKSRNASDLKAKFDTPSLKLVGGSAPYFHDGRYPDLKTLLVESDGKMGHTKQLSRDELDDLTAFLETL